MNDVLPSGMLVSALMRRVNDAGGMGMVRARGETGSGGILLILTDGGPAKLLERALDLDGRAELRPAGPAPPVTDMDIDGYWRRRRARDPDLWVVELDIASAERIAVETILGH